MTGRAASAAAITRDLRNKISTGQRGGQPLCGHVKM